MNGYLFEGINFVILYSFDFMDSGVGAFSNFLEDLKFFESHSGMVLDNIIIFLLRFDITGLKT